MPGVDQKEEKTSNKKNIKKPFGSSIIFTAETSLLISAVFGLLALMALTLLSWSWLWIHIATLVAVISLIVAVVCLTSLGNKQKYSQNNFY